MVGNQSKTFSVATYNIFDGRRPEQITQNILKLIRQGAHVICLQEVWPLYRGRNIRKLIDQHIPVHFKSQYYSEDGANWYDYGLGVLWDTNVFFDPTFNQLSFPKKSRLTLWDKSFFWILGLTPTIFGRGALIGTFTFGEKTVRITNLHLDFQGGDIHRANQLQSLTNYLNSQPLVDNEIICGDFNTIGLLGKQEKITGLKKILGNGFQSIFKKPYTSSIIQQLDYIFVKNLSVRQAKIIKLLGSDHYPLLAELSA